MFKPFDRPQSIFNVGSFQMIQQKIADMKCRLDASMLLAYRAAFAKNKLQGIVIARISGVPITSSSR